jgi:hypothetical protein
MNQKAIPALAIIVILWAAHAACGQGASARQCVTLEVVPAVEAAPSPVSVNSAGPEAGRAAMERAEWRRASLVVTPGSYKVKVTASLDPCEVVETSTEAISAYGGLARTPLRLTLTDY